MRKAVRTGTLATSIAPSLSVSHRAIAAGVRDASVYVHFPYCLAKCPYCDFVSLPVARDAIDHGGYADAVLAELDGRIEQLRGFDARRITSVFVGGGTPSLWATSELARVLDALRTRLPFSGDAEITVECNPTSLDEHKARELALVGVTRLSLGVQSLARTELLFLGRLHDDRGALASLRAARRSGLRIAADLVYGLPEQAPRDAVAQARAIVAEGVGHVSAYALTIEQGTPFGARARAGALPIAGDDAVADAFLALDDELARAGFEHYETSNYARPGERCRHNVGYWAGREYLGLGSAAYGFVATGPGFGVRYRNDPDPTNYMHSTHSVQRGAIGLDDGLSSFVEELDGEALLHERLMLGLRTTDGVDLEACAKELGVNPWTAERRCAIDRLVASGRLAIDGARLTIPRAASLFADGTAAALF